MGLKVCGVLSHEKTASRPLSVPFPQCAATPKAHQIGGKMFAKLLLGIALLVPMTLQADTSCISFAASPDIYAAPVPDSFDPNIYLYSFTVGAEYTNNCSGTVTLPLGSFGISEDPFAYSDLFLSVGDLAPGESSTFVHAGIVWLPGTPDGYVWNGEIASGDLSSPFTAIARGRVHVECSLAEETCRSEPIDVPEPGTMLLVGTGIAFLIGRRKR